MVNIYKKYVMPTYKYVSSVLYLSFSEFVTWFCRALYVSFVFIPQFVAFLGSLGSLQLVLQIKRAPQICIWLWNGHNLNIYLGLANLLVCALILHLSPYLWGLVFYDSHMAPEKAYELTRGAYIFQFYFRCSQCWKMLLSYSSVTILWL